MTDGRSALLTELADLRAERARMDAREASILAELASELDSPEPLDKDWVREDVACALGITSGWALARLVTARRVVHQLPAMHAAMAEGPAGWRHAERLCDAVADLPAPVAARVEAAVVPGIGERSYRSFCAAISRAVAVEAPRQSTRTFHQAFAERRVAITDRGDGTAELFAVLCAGDAAAIGDLLQQYADKWNTADEVRTADQRRADALAFLLAGHVGPPATAAPGAVGLRPRVHVTVPLATLLGLSDAPGELNGTPIPAEYAQALALDPTGTLRRLVVDGRGTLLDVGRGVYQVPADLARFVRLRDRSCRFPGCERAAAHCELDHRLAWVDSGTTSAESLHLLCTRHHHLKHEAGWTVEKARDDATVWRSPSGHRYRKPPPEPQPVATIDRHAPPPF